MSASKLAKNYFFALRSFLDWKPSEINASSEIPGIPANPSGPVYRIDKELVVPVEIAASLPPRFQLCLCDWQVNFFFLLRCESFTASAPDFIPVQYGLTSMRVGPRRKRIE